MRHVKRRQAIWFLTNSAVRSEYLLDYTASTTRRGAWERWYENFRGPLGPSEQQIKKLKKRMRAVKVFVTWMARS